MRLTPGQTTLCRINAAEPEHDVLALAAAALRGGGLVVFPTETVYGLGASALDPAAVERIFIAKGRPATNPLIVHVASVDRARSLVTSWPRAAAALAGRFWPGPLTIVLPRSAFVPDVVTAGGPTVALRMPAHPVALALLRASDLPLAAPSANRSMCLSATAAAHVMKDLDGRVDLVLDAGPTPGGIESTVVDLVSQPPRVLRPGLVSLDALRDVVPEITEASRAGGGGARAEHGDPAETVERSPGRSSRHYAPRTTLVCIEPHDSNAVQRACSRGGSFALMARESQLDAWRATVAAGNAATALDQGHECMTIEAARLRLARLPDEPAAAAARLYGLLHALDDERHEAILAILPPDTSEWAAIRDRLLRAGHG